MRINHKLLIFVLAFFLVILSGNRVYAVLDSAALAKEKLYLGLNEALYEPDKVFKLCLGGLELHELNPEIISMPNLQELNVAQNYLVELPEFICNLINLEEMKLSSNSLKELPGCFAGLSNLKRLELSSNPQMNWDKVYAVLIKINSLEYLDLSYNDLTFLPMEFQNMKNLKSLNLSGNNLNDDDKENIKRLLKDTEIEF